MRSELNEKINCCCSLFHAQTYKNIEMGNLRNMILFANDYLLSVDIGGTIEREYKEAGGFNQYYATWYKSISFDNIGIGFIIRYKQENEISRIVKGLDTDDKEKNSILNILGVVGMILASCLNEIVEALTRLRIAAGSNIEINIYRDKINFDNLLDIQEVPDITKAGFEYDVNMITKIYEYCRGDTFSVSFDTFVNAVAKADFSTIYEANTTKRAKCAYLISIIKGFVFGKDWYIEAAHSINTEPTKCSGMKVPVTWKNGLKRIAKG